MVKVQKTTIWEKGNILVGKLTFKSNGKEKIKEFIELKRKVVLIVPVDEKYVYLLKEYRPLFEKTVWRVPAGTLNLNENPKKGAERELLQETGLTTEKLTLLNNYEYMGWVKFPIFLFKAEELNENNQKLDFYEKIKLVKVSKKEAKQIALNEMPEPHHAFALLKCLEP
jgi:ADP-ribose pyrophosphatase